MNKLQKFLSKDWLLILSPILYFIGTVGMDTIYLITYKKAVIYSVCGHIFIAAIVLIACLSYKKHNKNVMKAVLGAMLALVCVRCIEDAAYYITYSTWDTFSIINVILSSLIALSAVIFFINHLILASDHKSNKRMINFNMITAFCYVAASIAWGIYAITQRSTINDYLYSSSWILFAIGSVILTINIETKVDYFKKIREEKENVETETVEEN